jgi:hypothetical protein
MAPWSEKTHGDPQNFIPSRLSRATAVARSEPSNTVHSVHRRSRSTHCHASRRVSFVVYSPLAPAVSLTALFLTSDPLTAIARTIREPCLSTLLGVCWSLAWLSQPCRYAAHSVSRMSHWLHRLYGISCAQTFFYFQFYPKDPLYPRALVRVYSRSCWCYLILRD